MWSIARKVGNKTKVGRKRLAILLPILLLGGGGLLAIEDNANRIVPQFQVFADSTGAFATLNLGGPMDSNSNPFFQDLGGNGRRCVTCHQPSDAWSVAPSHIQARFAATSGTDPIFRPVDGANCPTADVSTLEKRREAYSLLLNRGLIRVGIAVPANADYEVVSVQNQYGCSATDLISMYRRPLPTTNLQFLSTVMWDGRESSQATGTNKIAYNNYPTSLLADLAHQSFAATVGHAQGDGTRPTPAEQQQIVDFETKLFTAQLFDFRAGSLSSAGAQGGPASLSTQPFFISIDSSVHALLPAFEQPGGLMTPGDGLFTSASSNCTVTGRRTAAAMNLTTMPHDNRLLAGNSSSTVCQFPSAESPESTTTSQPAGWLRAALQRFREPAALATILRTLPIIPFPRLST